MSNRHRERGFSLVSSMAALAVLTTVTAGTASLVSYLVKQSQHSQRLNLAVTVNSQVESAILDKSQYQKTTEDGTTARDMHIIDMANGNPPTGFTYTGIVKQLVNGKLEDTTVVLAKLGGRVGYDVDGIPHPDDDARKYPLYVETAMKCQLSGECGVAYRVVLQPVEKELLPSALGAPLSQAAVLAFAFQQPPRFEDPGDYTLRLSYDFFKQKQFPSKCQGSQFLISGLSRTSGAVTCISPATRACAQGFVGDGVRAENGALETTCHALSQVQCPTDYVLQNYDFSQLDQGAADPSAIATGTKGRCVYRWRTDIPWQVPLPYVPTSTTSTAAVAACNAEVYDVLPPNGCVAAVVSSTPVTCTYACNCSSDSFGNTTCATCSRTAYSSASVTAQSIDPATNLVSCTVQVTDDCGSSMVAAPQWTGTCAVKERLINPSLMKAPVNGTLQ